MTDETRHAFGPVEARVAACAGTPPLDRISVRNHVVEVEIGAFAQERGLLQRVRFDIVVEVFPIAKPLDDDVDRILSYDRLTEAVSHELAAERINLLETLAERVAQRILLEPQAARVFIRIEKIDRGPYDLGVEIVRARDDAESDAVSPGQHPRIAVVPSHDPAGWMDELRRDAPLILVARDTPSGPHVQDEKAQRQIELLAMGQAAWQLASQDARCFVVGTWTELDWAMKNCQISVWAPARMVLDAVPPPEGDALALSVWLAEALAAVELVVVGGEAPKANVPVRVLVP
ncbi:dihydroneopterin aldolase [Pseudorhodobacter sp.]|uniref:dihydroneopterin aldolase n=1 Tax=Pseudorhodobacter sp. TaxID=1934400 RepID=UPI002648A7C1|nr:dihydroneopterin aldolase [Pseudorhodobacter sp.]MDN5787300.1 dihydroneopterin aldolase [Pseudorhodobacter sp.]